MAEWKEWNGSPEQIDEIKQCKADVLFEFPSGKSRLKSEMFIGDWRNCVIAKYMICNPHPLADMICQQARTGQPVWWRSVEGGGTGLCHDHFPPFAHPDKFEYSFTEFKEEV